ncbi:MAG: HNH endonuclease [Xanthobacteraceae bacterium]
MTNTPTTLAAEIGATRNSLVTRSAVPAGLRYPEYKPYLRHDFFHSCAYCTISESEATAIRFTIDHYEPKTSRRDLANEYTNLMYACDTCNQLKGNRCPPPNARAAGLRFFRPDNDLYEDHFQLSGIRLNSKTKVGEFSIEAIDLNRQALRRLRDLRRRLTNCDEHVAAGILALRSFHMDQLPQPVKGSAARTVSQAIAVGERMADEIDALLRDHARSTLIDPDPESEKRAAERSRKMDAWKALHPGNWRAPRKPAQGRNSKKKR